MTPEFSPKAPPGARNLELGGIRKRLLGLLALLVLGVVLYGLGGRYGGPWLVDRWLADFRAGGPGRTAQSESVRFNPFTLVTEITGFEIRDPATGAGFRARRLEIDLTARSLLELRPVIRSVVLEAPDLTLARWADLPALGRRARSAALHEVRIDALEATSGALTIAGRDPARISLTLGGFDGRDGAAARFWLDARMADGARLTADGTLDADLDLANGQLSLEAVDLDAVAAGLDGTVAAAAPAGRLDLVARFDAASLLTRPVIELTAAELGVTGMSLEPAAAWSVTSQRIEAEARLVLTTTDAGLDISGRLGVDSADLLVHDAGLTPPQAFPITAAALLLTVDPDSGLVLDLRGRLAGAGDAALALRVPAAATAARRVSLQASGLSAAMLAPYATGALGRPLAAGSADIEIEYELAGDEVAGTLGLVARELEFAAGNAGAAGAPGDPAAADDPEAADGPSLELAVALLENTERVVEMELPFAAHALAARDAAALALQARLATVTATPFDALGPLLADTGTASAIPFQPGDAALNDRALASIGQLVRALEARPRLGLRVHGGHDPVADRRALARQQIELHVQLATASPTAEPQPVDVDSARARDVLDEFAGERLPAGTVAELQERFDCEGNLVPLCRRTYYALILDALIENEEITPTMLNRLGRFRAQSVADALRQQGIASERIEIATGSAALDSPFGVGLPVELMAAATAPR